jgi:hypothetical protein
MTKPESGAVIHAGRPVIDRAGIAELHGMTWHTARRARPWATPGHPAPITRRRPARGHPQLWDQQQAQAFVVGLAVPPLPEQPQPTDLLDRFAAAAAAGVHPVTWASDRYDGRIPPPDKTIHGADWWYRDTVEDYRRQRAQPRPPGNPTGRPTGVTEPIPRSQVRNRVAAALATATGTGQPITTADIARQLGIHYTTALHHVHALTTGQPTESGKSTTTS